MQTYRRQWYHRQVRNRLLITQIAFFKIIWFFSNQSFINSDYTSSSFFGLVDHHGVATGVLSLIEGFIRTVDQFAVNSVGGIG